MKRKTKFRVGQVVRDMRKGRYQDDAYAQIIKINDAGCLTNGSRFRIFSELRPLTEREKGQP